jgi:hypothetical protein
MAYTVKYRRAAFLKLKRHDSQPQQQGNIGNTVFFGQLWLSVLVFKGA